MIDPGNGRYLAERIPNARYIEAPGSDHVFYFRTRAKILEAISWVLEQEPEPVEEDRFLSTVLAASSAFASGPVIVGEHVYERYETPHPYPSSGEAQPMLTWVDHIQFPGAVYIAVHFKKMDLAEGDYVVVR